MGGGASTDKGLGVDEITPKPAEVKGILTSGEVLTLVNAEKRSRCEIKCDTSVVDKKESVYTTTGQTSEISPPQQKSPPIEQSGYLYGRRDQKLPVLPHNEHHDLLRISTAPTSALQHRNTDSFQKKSQSMRSPRYLTPVLRIPPSSSFSDTDSPLIEGRPLNEHQCPPLSDSATANGRISGRLEPLQPSDVPMLDVKERSIPLSSTFPSRADDGLLATATHSTTKGFEYNQNPQSSVIGPPPAGVNALKPSSSSKSSSKKGHGHSTSEARAHSGSKGRPRSNTATSLGSVHNSNQTGKSSKGSQVNPRPPGSSRSRQSSADCLRSVATRSFHSIDDFDDLESSFMESFKDEVVSSRRSVVPPLQLNVSNITKDSMSPPFSRVLGMGLAPQGLRINTALASCNEVAVVTPSSSSALNCKSSTQMSQNSTGCSDRPLNHTPNSCNSGTRPTPTSMGASLYEVKETNDVKRNRAKLPPTMVHAKPTTGDWLKKRYIVNNYILLDTLGTGSYGEVGSLLTSILFNLVLSVIHRSSFQTSLSTNLYLHTSFSHFSFPYVYLLYPFFFHFISSSTQLSCLLIAGPTM